MGGASLQRSPEALPWRVSLALMWVGSDLGFLGFAIFWGFSIAELPQRLSFGRWECRSR